MLNRCGAWICKDRCAMLAECCQRIVCLSHAVSCICCNRVSCIDCAAEDFLRFSRRYGAGASDPVCESCYKKSESLPTANSKNDQK